MSPRYDDEWIAAMLDTDGRFGDVRPEALLIDTGLEEGQTVVDVGCGPGLLAFAAASVVGTTGKVYAVDVEQKMLDLVSSRAESSGLDNVVGVLSEGQRVPLPDGIAHYAICSQVLHFPDSFGDRVDMALDAARLVGTGGRLLVIEWVPEDGADQASRLGPEDTAEILRRAGLEPGEPLTLGDRQYSIAATSPGDGSR